MTDATVSQILAGMNQMAQRLDSLVSSVSALNERLEAHMTREDAGFSDLRREVEMSMQSFSHSCSRQMGEHKARIATVEVKAQKVRAIHGD